MSNRDNFIDAMGGLDEKLFAEHIARKYPSRAHRIKKYVMAAAIYAAACLAVAGILPFIIRQGNVPEPQPQPGNDPIKTELYGTSCGETDGVTSFVDYVNKTETSLDETEITETESSVVTEVDTTEPDEISATTIPLSDVVQPQTPGDDPAVTVHVQETNPVNKDTADGQEIVNNTTTTTQDSVTTTQKVTYPDPYIVEQTATSVTRRFYGCDYTLTVDKDKYAPGDIVNVTVTLANNGQEEIGLYNKHDNGRTHKSLLDRVAFRVSGLGPYDYSGAGVTSRMSLMPGESMTYTTRFDTTDADVSCSWKVYCEVNYIVNGKTLTQINTLVLDHDGCVDRKSAVKNYVNPFDKTEYDAMFKGTGEIVVVFDHYASYDWEKYLGPEYFGRYKATVSGVDPFEIKEIVRRIDYDTEQILLENDPGYGATVKLVLTSNDERIVQRALEVLYDISKDNDDAIYHAYPQMADYSAK